jgi:peptide deformylase
MATRTIIRMGHPTLRRPARRVRPEEIGGREIRRLLVDMRDTLQDAGGIGLAAPQIDEPVRLAIVEIPGGPSRYGVLDPLPLTVFINPSIEVLHPATAGYWEGCLSVPGLRGFVERPQHVKVNFTNLRGEAETLEFSGFRATVVQHELDHLEGKLFVDRITDPTKLVFEEEYERHLANPRASLGGPAD